MTDFPKITIVTPVFNRADYLEQTILSVISQAYPNLEYMIVDGGSTDGSVEIIKKYEKHLAWWTSEPDQGMYHAIQKGFERSTGDIMAWINSDDLYHNQCLFQVANVFNDLPDAQWIFGAPAFYNHAGYCVKMSKSRRWSKERFFIGDYQWIQQENVFWRRSLWHKAGAKLDTAYKYAADLELWSRFFKYAQLHNVETSFAGFRLHGKQISLNSEKEYKQEAEQVYKTIISGYFNKSELKLAKFLFRRFLKGTKDEASTAQKLMAGFSSALVNRQIKPAALIYYDFSASQWKK